MLIDERLARMRAHRSNIDRYQVLLRTELSEIESRLIERRLAEEQRAAAEVAALRALPMYQSRAGELNKDVG